MSGPDATEALERLAFDFDYWARPATGRYANQPALADERGLISVPPAVPNPTTKVAVAAALGGLAWYALSKRKSRTHRV
jgi:hypothetical protein